MLKTTNGGSNWTMHSMGTSSALLGITFIDEYNGIVVGQNGLILKTSDGGDTWFYRNSATSKDLNKVAFIDALNGTIAGNYGTILNTTDGGNTWSSQISKTNKNLYDVCLTSSFTRYVVGENGTILKTINGGIITELEEDPNSNSNSAKSYYLSQNYPNPFNPSTRIHYSVISTQIVSVNVYDLLGREIETLVNEEKLAGEYEVEFNGANLPSGIYFYQLKAGDYIETKKMVLIR